MAFLVDELKKEKIFLISLFLISFFIRILFFVLFFSKDQNYWTGDSFDYHDVALQIASGNGISDQEGNPSFWRVPGYSIFLAFFYKFFTQDIKKILLIQIGFTSFFPILIFIFSLVLFPSNILLAKSVGVFSSINLGLIISSCLVMSDALFLFFFLLFLILFCSSFELFFCKKDLREMFLVKKLLLAGLFLGVASLIRPVGQYLIFISILLLMASNSLWKLKMQKSFWLLLGWSCIVLWWLLRNYFFSGGFIFFHTMSKQHFLNYVAIPIEMRVVGGSFDQAHNRLRRIINDKKLETEQNLGRSLHEIEVCKLTEYVSFKYLIKDPIFACKKFIWNLIKTCFDLHVLYHKKALDKFIYIFFVYEILLLLFLWVGFLGFFINIFKNLNLLCGLLKVIPFVLVFLGLTVVEGFARLRLPIEPFVVIFSLYFWMNVFLKKREIRC